MVTPVLTEYLNGVKDQFGRFFPFKLTSGGLDAKTGLRYYIHSVTLTFQNSGDNAASFESVQAYVESEQKYIAMAFYSASKTDVMSNSGTITIPTRQLCDAETAIAQNSNAVNGDALIVYAEIPNDYQAMAALYASQYASATGTRQLDYLGR